MPIERITRSYFVSIPLSKMISASAGHEQPGVLLDLVLDLSGGPSRVAKSEHRPIGPVAARDRLQDVDGGVRQRPSSTGMVADST